MRLNIESVWNEGSECLDSYKEALRPFDPVVKTWWEHNREDIQAWKRSKLSIELNSLDDLVKLVDRVGNSVIVKGDYSLEIYDSYRE